MKIASGGHTPPEQPSLFEQPPINTAADLAYGAAVKAAPTTADAWGVLSPTKPKRTQYWATLSQACLNTHAAAERGHTRTKALAAIGQAIPQSWIDRLCVLEAARLEAIWSLGDYEAAQTPPAEVVEQVPSALVYRILSVATRRYGELDPPPGLWLDVAMARIDEMAPGWDTVNTREACLALIRGSVQALYGHEETADTPSPASAVSTEEEEGKDGLSLPHNQDA